MKAKSKKSVIDYDKFFESFAPAKGEKNEPLLRKQKLVMAKIRFKEKEDK